MFKWLKSLGGYSEINNDEPQSLLDDYDEGIIPRIVYEYFPIPQAKYHREEFEFVMRQLCAVYDKSIGCNYIFDKFVVMYRADEFIDFISADRKEIEKVVSYIKSRPEMDVFLKKYGFDNEIKKGLVEKNYYIDNFIINHGIQHLSTSEYGIIRINYNILSMKYRERKFPYLFSHMDGFKFSNLMELSVQIKESRWHGNRFWEEYDYLWAKFECHETFSPWEYARAFMEIYLDDVDNSRNKISLLRLSRTDLLKSYDGIEGVYYYLYALEKCIKRGLNPKKLESWMLEGLRMYGNKKDVISFCKMNSIEL